MFPLVGAGCVSNFFPSIGKAKVSIFSRCPANWYALPCLPVIFPALVWVEWHLDMSMPVSDSWLFITAVISLMIYIKRINTMPKTN